MGSIMIIMTGKGDLCWGGGWRLLPLSIGRLQVTTSILNIFIITINIIVIPGPARHLAGWANACESWKVFLRVALSLISWHLTVIIVIITMVRKSGQLVKAFNTGGSAALEIAIAKLGPMMYWGGKGELITRWPWWFWGEWSWWWRWQQSKWWEKAKTSEVAMMN